MMIAYLLANMAKHLVDIDEQALRILSAKHQRGRKIPDLLVAAAAEQNGLSVLHYDAAFDRIAAVTGQRCQWGAPAGSIG